MISVPTVRQKSIQAHYDLSTLFYRLLWGPHLHHGLWQSDESSRVAQLHLTEKLTELAGIQRGERVLDVGCGMGGSTIHLAKVLGCHTQGVTLSPLQRKWASLSARWHGVSQTSHFRCLDIEQTDYDPQQFDVVWSIECTEHLFDKPQLLQKAARWLKPGGRVAICAWLAGENLEREEQIQQVKDVCRGFLCPSLGTASDYIAWMEAAGLQMSHVQDWTDRVSRTWEICRERVRRFRIRWIARAIDQESVLFLDHFDTILDAYRNGAMRYGCFVAQKPK